MLAQHSVAICMYVNALVKVRLYIARFGCMAQSDYNDYDHVYLGLATEIFNFPSQALMDLLKRFHSKHTVALV